MKSVTLTAIPLIFVTSVIGLPSGATADENESNNPAARMIAETDPWTYRVITAEQQAFLAIVSTAQQALAKDGNLDDLRRQRANALRDSGIVTFRDWIGVLDHMPSDGGDGFISIQITLSPHITLKTAFDVAPGSPVFTIANPLRYGTIVQFSGRFVPDGKDYFKETSLTTHGSLEDPDWLIQIDSIKALD